MATLKVIGGKDTVEVKSVEVKKSVLHRAVVAEEANSRQGTQKAKTRSEVKGGGRKPYKQKKTGRARQGTIRAPHYAHGGVVFAPVPRDYEKKVNRKERRLALKSAFAVKADAGDVIVVETIAVKAPKTKDAVAMLKTWGADVKRVLVIVPSYDEAVVKSFRNLPNVEVRTAPARIKGVQEGTKTQAFSTRDLLLANKVVVAKDALSAIEEAWS